MDILNQKKIKNANRKIITKRNNEISHTMQHFKHK